MDFSNPIVYELGLTVVALVAFAIWQTVTLKRDMRRTREEDAAREAQAAQAAHGERDGEPPAGTA
ncbi:MAG TPA: hypothetical protein VFR90_01015 [Methylibium sp.]|uniref:hypothetical protein n=1 Tax=Methylibium sp. TaxID=2067992 RepID=UPI002DBE45FB|nr:hypothetical protein [Methylibium sp.]HEU4457686.1 hypothetical protein [Methylibium sp.]